MSYADKRAKAHAMLSKNGKSVQLTRSNSQGDYDPITGEFTTTGDTTLNGVGVLLGYKAEELNSTTVLATDRKLLYIGDTAADDDVQVGDKYGDYRVFSVKQLAPDETDTVLVTAQLRK